MFIKYLINSLIMSIKPVISAVTQKRLMGELKLLHKEPLELIDTYPDEKDSLIWYFVVRGPEDTDYTGGFYIGKILHSPEYPYKPPEFMMLTPSGRFDIEKKICLTNSGYHLESWSALWNMKTLLIGFLSIMADDSTSGISHIKESVWRRNQLASESINYNMKYHSEKWLKFERFVNLDGTPKTNEEIKKLSEPQKKKKVIVVEQKPEQKVDQKVDQKVEQVIVQPIVEQKAEQVIVHPIVEQKIEPIIVHPIVEQKIEPVQLVVEIAKKATRKPRTVNQKNVKVNGIIEKKVKNKVVNTLKEKKTN